MNVMRNVLTNYQYDSINSFTRRTEELSALVSRMEQKINNAIQLTASIESHARLGAELLNVMDTSNAIVAKESGLVKVRSEEIRNAAEEQKNASGEIVKSVAGINELTQANASGALKITESADTVLSMSDVLKKPC